MSSTLTVTDLSLKIAGKDLLKSISTTFEPGSFTIMAGPNGSGKSLLMRCLNGLLKPTSGEVLLDKKPVLKKIKETRKKIGIVFQNPDYQFVEQTVEDDIMFGPKNLKLEWNIVESRTEQALKAVNLEGFNDRHPHTLSGGEKRRAAVAGIIAVEPEILILDEPFTALDRDGAVDLLRIITKLHSKGTTIILISHDLEKCLAHADKLIILQKGELVFDGLPKDAIDKLELWGIRKPYGKDRSIKSMTWL